MRKLLQILLTTLISCTSMFAQLPTWWNINSAPNTMIINLDVVGNNFTMDGNAIPNGSTIGAFIDTAGATNPVCIGNVTYQGTTTSLDVFEPSSNTTSDIYFLLWDNDNTCTAYDISTTIIGYDYQFQNGETITMSSFSAQSTGFYYEKTEYCTSEKNAVPIINGKPHDADFSSSISIDASTGEIDLVGASTGYHLIEIMSGACLDNVVFNINILSDLTCNKEENVLSPNSTIPEYQTHFINCTGNIEIFDRSGQIVRSTTGPFYWDGTNNNGVLLPADEYYINCPSLAPIAITLIH